MSDALYPTRLRWHHTCGIARHDDVQRVLHAAPALPGLDCMTEIDYIPQVIAQVRIGCQQVREMTQEERAAALAMLVRMSTGAKDGMDGGSTVVVVSHA